MKKWFSLLIVAIVVIYRDSFTSPFFQDDQILFDLPWTPIANFPYRPISQTLFYTVGRQLFGINSLAFHLVLFGIFLGTLYLIFNLAKKLLHSENKAAITTIFYALNISLFACFYWVATSYFTIGVFFFFLTIYLYIQKRNWECLIAYLLAIGSNELALVLPLVFILVSWWQKSWSKKSLLFYLLSLPLLLVARLLIGLPKAADYTFNFSSFFANLRWYLFRAFNLPEGVQRSGEPAIYALFFIFIAILIVSFLKKRNWQLFFLSAIFFLLAAAPFFFLPGHMSSYYLTMSLFGPALFFGDTFEDKKIVALALAVYLLLTILGLNFLSSSHWIILKNTGPIGQF